MGSKLNFIRGKTNSLGSTCSSMLIASSEEKVAGKLLVVAHALIKLSWCASKLSSSSTKLHL